MLTRWQMLKHALSASDALEMKPPAKRFKIGNTTSTEGTTKFHSVEGRARTGKIF